MLSRRPSHHPAITLAIFAALALLLPFAGCGAGVHMDYLHTGLDSAVPDDTGELEPVDNAFTFVEGLPVECPSVRPYVKLPPSGGPERTRESYSEAEVDLAVRGDADYPGPPVTLYPVIFAGDRWVVSGSWAFTEGRYAVTYAPEGTVLDDEPFTLACG